MARVGKRSKSPMKSVQRGMGNANASLKSITAVLDQQSDALKQIQDNSVAVQSNQGAAQVSANADALNSISDAQRDQLVILKKIQATITKTIPKPDSPLAKDTNDYLKKLLQNSTKQIDLMAKGNKDWRTFADKIKDFKANLKNAFDPDTIKKSLLSPLKMFKGVRDKMEDIDYAKRMRAMGDTRSSKDLKAAAKDSREKKEQVLRTNAQYQKMKAAGATDDDIAKSNPAFIKQRKAELDAYNATRVAYTGPGGTKATSAALPKTPSDKGNISQSTTDVLAEKQSASENQAEMLRNLNAQTDLLQQIATNTALMAGRKTSSAGGGEDKGSAGGAVDALGGIGKSMGKIGGAIAGIGQGIGKALGGVFQGIMEGIAAGISAFASAKVLGGTLVLGLVTAVIYGLALAVQQFQDIDWETFAKAGVAILGVIAAGAGAGAIAPLLGLGAAALLGLGAAIWTIGKGMEAMGDNVDGFIKALDKLTGIDYTALSGVAVALGGLGAAFAAFGAGQAAAGIGSFVGNLLTKVSGGKTPVEQIVDIGNAGAGVQQAADGIGKLAGAMGQFSKVDKDSLKPLKDFPWEKATAFAAAGGAMEVNGAKVYNSSKTNADGQAQVDKQNAARASAPSGGNTVNAQQNNNQTTVNKPSVRNQESSYSKYLQTRY